VPFHKQPFRLHPARVDSMTSNSGYSSAKRIFVAHTVTSKKEYKLLQNSEFQS
jgi:hypothetical protein